MRKQLFFTVTILSLLAFFIPTFSQAQEKSVLFKKFSSNKGSWGSGINSILQDKQGFIYVGTQTTFDRFDGINTKSYEHDPENPNSPSGPRVSTMLLSPRGNIWFGTEGAGLNRFDPVKEIFTHYLPEEGNPNSLNHLNVRALHIDSQGVLWIGTAGGLNSFDLRTEKFTSYLYQAKDPEKQQRGKNWINTIFEDAQRTLWIGTKRGVVRFDLQQKEFIYSNLLDEFNLSEVTSIQEGKEGKEGQLWIGTTEGLKCFNLTTEQTQHFRSNPEDSRSLSNNYITVLHRDSQNRLWIGTREGGLNLWKPKQKNFNRYQKDPKDSKSLDDNHILSIYSDSTGNLWVGARLSSNLHLYNEARVKIKNISLEFQGIQLNGLIGLLPGKGETLWVGSRNHGLILYSPKKGVIKQYKHDPKNPYSLGNNQVGKLWREHSGMIWIATKGGVDLFDPKTERFTHLVHDPNDPFSLSSNNVMYIFEDSLRRLWVSTRDGGLNLLDRKSGRFTRFLHDPKDPSSLGSLLVNMVFEDKDKRIWIATFGGGLNEFLPESNRFRRYLHDPKNPNSLSSNMLRAIHESEDGTLWLISKTGGLISFDKHREIFKRFNKKNGFPSNNILGILEDDKNNLWLSSWPNGIIRFSPKDQKVQVYNEDDGISNRDGFWSFGFYKDAKGFLHFTGANIDVFHPDQMESDPYPPPVVLTAFRKFEKDFDLKKAPSHTPKLELSYEDTFFGFEFAALHYAAPEKNQFLYKMEGFDQNWITPRNHYAIYTNLDPGNYTFRVKASNSDGVWNNEGLSINVDIEPPPWEAWWAYILYVMLILGGVLLIVSEQIKKLEKKTIELEQEKKVGNKLREAAEQFKLADRLKDDFLANTSHELKTPLVGIVGVAETMLEGIHGEISSSQTEDLNMIVQSGKRLSNLVNDILDFSKIREGELQLQIRPVGIKGIVQIVLALLQGEARKKGILLTNHLPDHLPLVEADEDRVHQIFLNLLDNAIKFTHEGEVTLSAISKKSKIHLSISDTGIGIPIDRQKEIFQPFSQSDSSTGREYGGTGLGLSITQQLVELQGGEIFVKSSPKKGSTFSFTLPISSNQDAQETELASSQYSESFSPSSSQSPSEIPSQGKIMKNETGEKQYIILVVDDEQVNRHVFRNQLSLKNYQVLTASDGFQAMEIIEKQVPDLVLLDLMMPRMNGYEVCQKLRETYSPSLLPIIILTAKNQVQDLVLGFQYGANDYLSKPFHKDELISRVQSQITLKESALALKESALALKEAEQKKIELLTARAVQQFIIPQKTLQVEGIELASFYRSASEIGGDTFDFRYQPDSKRLDVMIGDVSGHGVPAALVSTMISSFFHAMENYRQEHVETEKNDDLLLQPDFLLNQLSNLIHGTTGGEYCATFFYSVLDFKKRTMYFVNAAHNPTLAWRSGGFTFLQHDQERKREVTQISGELGFRLGYKQGNLYQVSTQSFEAGDVLVWYTDGLIECKNKDEKQFGRRGLKRILKDLQDFSAEEIKDKIIGYVYDYMGDTPQEDDITLIVAKIKEDK